MHSNQFLKEKRTDLAYVLLSRNMTVDQASKASGISPGGLGKLVSGTRDVKKLNITQFVHLAKALRIPVQELIKILGIE